MKSKPHVSLRAIAEKAQVTPMTVSNALNNKGRMSDANRSRIKEIATQMGYRPNLQARGMQTGKSRIIGVMVPAMGYYEPMVQGIHDTLDQNDYNMLITWPRKDMSTGDESEEHAKINRLIALRVDGMITRPTYDHADEHYFRESVNMGIPMVAVDRQLTRFNCHFAGTHDYQLGLDAAEHLLTLGHRRLAIVNFDQNVSVWNLRQQGFIDGIADADQSLRPQIVSLASPNPSSSSEQTLAALLKQKQRPTAIFAVNDDLAAHVYQIASEQALRIPEDLSVLSCGNQEISRTLRPQLSSFDQAPYQIGQAAAKLLLDSLNGDTTEAQTRLISPRLVSRASCANPADHSK